jgi:ADP-ribose pyrophosphatase YjhB (NUDIX family)
MKNRTLVFVFNDEKVLLGMKKRGFGEGKWNGFGGKLEEGESLEDATIREMKEECQIDLERDGLDKVAELDFNFPSQEDWNQVVHVFIANNFSGKEKETEEMKPEWFHTKELPFDSMWDDDKYWLPEILSGKKVKARFVFEEDNSTIKEHEIKPVEKFD